MTATTAVETTEMPPREGIKETLESIVVALILAFVFRAFIVEAFVIPTGSMAPTLYGAHGTLLCEDCGIEFAYGLKDTSDTRRSALVKSRSRAVCPNCNHPNSSLKMNDERSNPEKGDRILVLKWPFYLGGSMFEPTRWDIIVFKDPADGTTNFIKRLIGLPNEVVMIMDGDVYAVGTDQLSKKTLDELEQLRHEKYELRVGLRDGRLRRVPQFVLNELDAKMTIQRKTDAAQQVLWTLVYDHDHPPRKLDPNQPRWAAYRGGNSGWDATSGRVQFKDHSQPNDYIELVHKAIRADNAYNIYHSDSPPVSDMRVQFVWTPNDSDAVLLVRLEKGGRSFWAWFSADGNVKLLESPTTPTDSTPSMASTHVDSFRPGQSVEIDFENLDYRLSIKVSGKEILHSSDDSASQAYYAPNLTTLRRKRNPLSSSPRLYGLGGDFQVSHLVVERDEHYYHDSRSRALRALSWAPRTGWGSPQSPILLRGHEYFMLGDNTAASKDSRLWDTAGPHLVVRGEDFQLGTVPRDQLIGKAFFVYWPSGHRLDWLPIPRLKEVGVIPDVGRMRWIR